MKTTVGLLENVEIRGDKKIGVYALFDTGAARTSLDITLATKARVGPVIKTASVKNPSLKGRVSRPVVKVELIIKKKKFSVDVSLQDRSHMTFPMIVGRDVIAGNFLVDAEKNLDMFDVVRKKRLKSQRELKSYF